MVWNLYENEKLLKPLVFSNGKSQEDVVKEVIKSIENGKKVIFIQGICGTGKSAIALNIANELGRASIIVPIKNLQEQYRKDYAEKKYLLKPDKTKLKINVTTGRKNHECPFLRDNKNAIPKIKSETNDKLNDIFSGKRESVKRLIENDLSADNRNLPCKIEIKEKNWNILKGYLKQNKNIDYTKLLDIKDVRRASVAGVCPYWCPVVKSKYELKSFSESKKEKYTGLSNEKFVYHKGRPGCGFYQQFDSFINSDVIVFNSPKYKLESAMNRKPYTEIEIVDECDEFLDSFSNQANINLDRLQMALIRCVGKDEASEAVLHEIREIIWYLKKNIQSFISSKEIVQLKRTGLYDLFRIFLKDPDFLEGIDEESYLFDVLNISKMFEEYLDETYVTFNKNDDKLMASVVTTNLAKKFKEMVDKNKAIVLMSGTLHSDNVLKNIFGIEDHCVIDAEVEKQGRINVKRTGSEIDCKYSNFSSKKYSRNDYLKALDKCVGQSNKPTLVHVNAFMDLPSKEEMITLGLNNLISREELRETQNRDKTGELIEQFKKGDTEVLFSTRASRGMDFPGDECNSIVFTKYPNPNVQDAFWKILMKTKPQFYWDFYRDKAKRELWQKIYRGLRHKNDKVDVLSPDSRVLEAFEKE